MGRHFMSAGALLVTLALTVGCGSSSTSTTNTTAKFKTGYANVRKELKATTTSIGNAITQATSKTDAEIGTIFKGLANTWQTQVSQLQTLKPPANVAADFNTIKDAVTRVEADLNAVVAAAATHSSSAAQQAGASIVTDLGAAKTADTTITQKLGIK